MNLRPAILGSVAVAIIVSTAALSQTAPADPNPPRQPEQEMKPGAGWSDAAQSNKPEKVNTAPTKSKGKKAATDAGAAPK